MKMTPGMQNARDIVVEGKKGGEKDVLASYSRLEPF